MHFSFQEIFPRGKDHGAGKAGFEKREKRRNIRQLQCAIKENNNVSAKELLDSDFEIDFQYNSQTCLQLAVCQGNTEISKLLIEKVMNML